ncbi:MAG TPA: hypothetical protein VF711_11740 [Acidimicrobiales bacterium]|jgi:hypothetical protein
MESTSDKSVVYELRALTNRWESPSAGPVISSHATPKAAWDAFNNAPKEATDGTGRSTYGNFVAKAVVRVDPDGTESMILPPPAGEGILNWPYSN